MNVIRYYSTNIYSAELPKLLAELDKTCFEKDKMTEREWEKFFKHEKNFFLVWAKDNETKALVGVALIIFGIAGIAYLYSNAVLPSYRKKGIGTELLARRISFIKNIATKIQTHTRANNTESTRILKASGFIPIQYVIDFYGEFEDGVLFELKLKESGRT